MFISWVVLFFLYHGLPQVAAIKSIEVVRAYGHGVEREMAE
jgi:hypothetical protein